MIDSNDTNLEQKVARLEFVQKLLLDFLHVAFNYDMGTPLTRVKGYTNLLKTQASLTAQQKTWLAAIEEATNDLIDIVHDTLIAESIERARISPLKFDAVDLKPIIEAGVNEIMSRVSMVTESASVSLHLPDSLPPVRADSGMISYAVDLLAHFILRNYRTGQMTGSASLTDDEVEMRIDYLVDKSRAYYKVDLSQFETASTCFAFDFEDGSLPLYLSWLIFKWHKGKLSVDFQDTAIIITFSLPRYKVTNSPGAD